DQPALQPVPEGPDPPAASEAPPKADPPRPRPEATSKTVGAVHYQIGALRKSAEADKLVARLKQNGFPAFIVAPPPDDPNPLFRVQVGPFPDANEAQDIKKKLESEGYQPIVKK